MENEREERLSVYFCVFTRRLGLQYKHLNQL